jgi:hypothetical protein
VDKIDKVLKSCRSLNEDEKFVVAHKLLESCDLSKMNVTFFKEQLLYHVKTVDKTLMKDIIEIMGIRLKNDY